jgi:thiosulfate/3-mercaptopyruvate sulfurtransferase
MTGRRAAPPLVSRAWLAEHLGKPGIQVIENAWVPEGYPRAHIPGAVPLPSHPYLKHFDPQGRRTQHVLSPAAFADVCEALGLRRDSHCIVYDDYHGLMAARFWWVARYHGLDNISVLDGGWHGWLEQGGPVTAQVSAAVPGTDVVVALRPQLIIGQAELERIHRDPAFRLWDTRRPEEYSGEDSNDNRRRGHVPGARHLVWTDLLDAEGEPGTACFLRPAAELAARLAGADLTPDHTIITYCQSGIRAAFCALVLEHLGYRSYRLYDASMGEWSNLPKSPLDQSPLDQSPLTR